MFTNFSTSRAAELENFEWIEAEVRKQCSLKRFPDYVVVKHSKSIALCQYNNTSEILRGKLDMRICNIWLHYTTLMESLEKYQEDRVAKNGHKTMVEIHDNDSFA